MDFDSHPSFDAWFSQGTEYEWSRELGWPSLDGSASGYVVNDLLIRTPALIGYEATYFFLMPIALPYYGWKGIVGDSPQEGAAEAPREEESAREEAPAMFASREAAGPSPS